MKSFYIKYQQREGNVIVGITVFKESIQDALITGNNFGIVLLIEEIK